MWNCSTRWLVGLLVFFFTCFSATGEAVYQITESERNELLSYLEELEKNNETLRESVLKLNLEMTKSELTLEKQKKNLNDLSLSLSETRSLLEEAEKSLKAQNESNQKTIQALKFENWIWKIASAALLGFLLVK